LDDGSLVSGRRVLVTTGLVDELPEIVGLRERWGRDVLHCPYCHGWEFRDRPIGVLGSGPRAVHQALLFRQWTRDLVLFTHTMDSLTSEQTEELVARGIQIIDGVVESLEVADDRLVGVRLQNGTLVAREAIAVMPRFVARSQVLASLGLRPAEHPLGIGEVIVADSTGLTQLPGIWTAGNVMDLQANVIQAVAEGSAAAAAINADLVAEDTRLALVAYRKG
jgi:thioredoxin reductase